MNYRIGFCSRCNNWLGDEGDNGIPRDNLSSEAELTWQIWNVERIGELLAIAPSVAVAPTQYRIKEGVTLVLDRLANGSPARLASYIGGSRSTVWSWANKCTRIRISDLLAVCYCCRINPIEFLIGDLKFALENADPTPTKLPTDSVHRRLQRPAFRRLNKNKLGIQLEGVLSLDDPPVSFVEVAESLGVSVRYLRRLFPSLCVTVSKHCSKSRRLQKKEKAIERRQDIEEAIAKVRSSGKYPSRRRVIKAIKEAGRVPYHSMIPSVLRELSENL